MVPARAPGVAVDVPGEHGGPGGSLLHYAAEKASVSPLDAALTAPGAVEATAVVVSITPMPGMMMAVLSVVLAIVIVVAPGENPAPVAIKIDAAGA